jgi:hypothetical protein
MSHEDGAEVSLKGSESNLAQNLHQDFAKLLGLFKMALSCSAGLYWCDLRGAGNITPFNFHFKRETESLRSEKL